MKRRSLIKFHVIYYINQQKIIFVVVVRVFTKENIFETKQFLQAKVTTLKTFVIWFDRKHILGCLSFP